VAAPEPSALQPSAACAADSAAAAPLLAYVDLDCAYLRGLVLQALSRRPGWRVQEAAADAAAADAAAAGAADAAAAGAAADECTSPEGTEFCWSEYERTDWSAVLAGKQSAAAYCVRKGLIRKSQFAYNMRKFASKRPQSLLALGVPETHLFEFWDIEYIDVRTRACGN
jgi:hypothetical protein